MIQIFRELANTSRINTTNNEEANKINRENGCKSGEDGKSTNEQMVQIKSINKSKNEQTWKIQKKPLNIML